MKLIDILVQELPKRGGWPIDSDDERTLNSTLPDICWGLDGGGYYAFRGPSDNVSHQLYEETLLAIKSGWNGEGLPPVGCECEIFDKDGLLRYGHGESGEVIAHIENTAVIRMSYGLGCFNAEFLRPARSEADKKRDATCDAMHKSWREVSGNTREDGSLIDIYSCIYDAIAAGKIPHIRID